MSGITAPEGYRTFSMGTGKVVHAAQDADTVTLCGKPFKVVKLAHSPFVTCSACGKKAAILTAPKLSEIDIDTIPGLGKNARPVTAEKEVPDMAATAKMDKAAQDKAAEEIRTDIERLPSLIAEGKADAATELQAEIKAAYEAITGTGAAGVKAKLRAEANKAVKDAEKAVKDAEKAKAAKAPAAEVEILGTKDFTKVEGVPERITAAAEMVKEVAAQKFARGKEVAEAIFDIRSHILDKEEDPDLTARSDQAKKASTSVYDTVLAGLPEEGTNESADIIREAIGDIKKDVRNAMGDVVVGYVRSLDTTPEDPEELKVVEAERAKFKKALDANPDLKPSEAIYKHYEKAGKALPSQTRAEIAKANREKKALEAKKIKDAVDAGELSEEEAEAALSGAAEKSPKELRAAWIKKTETAFKKQIKAVREIEDAEEQEAELDTLTALLANVRKEIKG
ncbi:hypothetical protein [Streptomyces sp. H27-C3]|uniref:hypothetical protein n=1 Tax=Streptomyces sp. H27-C3 TaxID=3046305 RepID=UPI0024B8D43E|nr:hypothetical protein [Streptomyces sp. H27-C3]MDJ0462000.1 hypothetical protein [Streptomyces sp. H27-C3]